MDNRQNEERGLGNRNVSNPNYNSGLNQPRVNISPEQFNQLFSTLQNGSVDGSQIMDVLTAIAFSNRDIAATLLLLLNTNENDE